MTEEISRRSFAKMAGVAIGGLVIGAVGGYSLMPPKEIVVEKEVEVPQDIPEHPILCRENEELPYEF